ncbi:MAG: Mut7-C RNAse domain-containing protein [Deltaproteobacteria bacterium]|nr:Mut7-C RNAse domain-containing protein [Deltaproteobacteria bacterium]
MSGCPRFIADAMLGKLARWLRTLGCDVAYESDIEDRELLRRAIDEERVILTRDTLFIRRRAARGRSFFVEGDLIDDQLKQVSLKFGIGPGNILTRCLRCNMELREMDKEKVRGKVPQYVFETQERFSACERCGRVYWGGTHKERMIEAIEKMLKT